MTISGFASSIAAASASASKTSTTTGRAPSLRTNSELSGERVVPQTEWPWVSRRGVSRRPMTPPAPARKIRLMELGQSYAASSGPQVFVEPSERPLPRLFRRRLVVARRRVIVEAVVGARVDMPLVGDAGRTQRRVESGPAAGDARVELTILGVDRRLDFGGIGGAWLKTVEGNRGVEARAHAHGQFVDDAAAKAEPDRAELAGRIGQGLQPCSRGGKIRLHFGAVDLLEQRRALFVVAGIAADRSEAVGREGDEIGDREAPRHVLDVWVQAAVLMHDQDDRQLLRARGTDEIALD